MTKRTIGAVVLVLASTACAADASDAKSESSAMQSVGADGAVGGGLAADPCRTARGTDICSLYVSLVIDGVDEPVAYRAFADGTGDALWTLQVNGPMGSAHFHDGEPLAALFQVITSRTGSTCSWNPDRESFARFFDGADMYEADDGADCGLLIEHVPSGDDRRLVGSFDGDLHLDGAAPRHVTSRFSVLVPRG